MPLSRFVGVCLALSVVACTSVRPVAPAKLTAKELALPHVVSVTYPDNSVTVVMDPAINADTLRGLRWGTQDSVTIPLQNVETVQAKVPDRTKTLLLAGVVGLAVASGVYVMLGTTGKPNSSDQHCFGDEAIKHPEEFPECGT